MKLQILAVLLTGASQMLVPAAMAQQAGTPATARDWVELQKGGTAASPVPRPLPGDIAERSYERYAESFSQPIPETLEREGFIEEGGGQ